MIRTVLSLLLLSVSSLVASCGGGGGGSGMTGIPDPANSTLSSPAPFGAPADGTTRVDVQAVVRTATGDPATGHPVQFVVTGDGASFLSDTVNTNGQGIATVRLRASVAGQKVITATISPNAMIPLPIPGSLTVTFVAPREAALFVRTTGNNSNSGDNALEAFATVGFALSRAEAGDTVFVGAGTYNESLTHTTVAPDGEAIELRADVDGEVTGDAGAVVLEAGGSNFGVRIEGAENFVMRGFTITGAAPTTENGGAIWLTGAASTNVALLENKLFGNTRGVTVTNATRVHLEDNVVSNNLGALGDGISLADATDCIVTRNRIYGNGAGGIVIGTGTTTQLVSYNTLYQNAGVQIRALSGTSSAVNHNIAASGGTSGLVIDTGAIVVEDHNILFGHPANDYSSGAGNPLSGTSSTADPLLVDPDGADDLLGGADAADDDFSIAPASPGVDAGLEDADATFFPFGGFARAMSTRTDGVFDGLAPDGDLVNIGFHAREQEAASIPNLAAGESRVIWAEAGDVTPKSASLPFQSSAWTAPVDATPTNVDVRWLESRRSPIAPIEAYVTLTDNGTFTNLFARVWDGLEWSEESFFNQLTSPYPSANSEQRAFDVEFEGQSGDLMLVRGNETGNPIYRVWSQGRWSADQPVYMTAPSGGSIRWIEMAADPNSDRLCVVCLDDNDFLSTSVWDGDEWDTDHTLLDTLIASSVTRAFDVTFESQSGDLLVVWGHQSTGSEEVKFSTRAPNSTTWIPGLLPSIDSYGGVVRLAANHADDMIALVSCEALIDDDFSVSMWDGNMFGDTVELDGAASPNQVDAGAAWNGAGNRCVVMFRDDDSADTVDFARWRPGGWNVIDDITVPGLSDPVLYQSSTDIQSNLARFIVQDSAGQLWEFASGGDDMAVQNGGAPITTGLPDNGVARPFGFVQRP